MTVYICAYIACGYVWMYVLFFVHHSTSVFVGINLKQNAVKSWNLEAESSHSMQS